MNIAVKNTSEELARLQAEKQLLDKKLVGMRKDNFVQQQQETAFKKMQNDLSLLQSQYSLIRKKLQNVKEELKIQENLFSEQEKAYSKRRIKMETEIRRLQMHKERISRNNGGK